MDSLRVDEEFIQRAIEMDELDRARGGLSLELVRLITNSMVPRDMSEEFYRGGLSTGFLLTQVVNGAEDAAHAARMCSEIARAILTALINARAKRTVEVGQ